MYEDDTTTDMGTIHLGNLGSFQITCSNHRDRDFKNYNRKGRIYLSSPNPESLGLGTSPESYSSDDGGLNDQAWKAWNRLEVKVMRMFADHAVEGKKTFSAKAGCSCPCSPGFISQNPLHRGRNIYVDVKTI